MAITPPARSDSAPTVALTVAPAAIAMTIRATAANAGQRRAARDQPAHQQRRDQDLEQVAERLADRRAERKRRVVVDQQVADQHTRPQPDTTEVQEGDGDPDRQPEDGGDRAGELERVADLGGGRSTSGPGRRPEPGSARASPPAAHAVRARRTRER
jgi:hypothetical protein